MTVPAMPHGGPTSPSRDLNFNNMVQTFTVPSRQHSHHGHQPQHQHLASHYALAGSSTHRTGSMDRLRKDRASDNTIDPAPAPAPARHTRSSFSVPPSTQSSASGSKSSSFIGTPRLLSRRSSARESQRPAFLGRSDSIKGKSEEQTMSDPSGGHSPDEQEEVVETAELRMDRDPGTGRKMINQYLVLHEIGHGTHGRVRLGRDMSVDVPQDELEADLATGSGPFFAIKIVERNPKKKRLNGLGRQRALGRTDGAKFVAENEMRKEIAIVKKLHHPNVVRMKEIIDDPDSTKLFMVFEYCEGGEVEWKGDGGPALSLAATRKIFRDTLLGLEYLHHQGIIHRDIKPSNLLRSNGNVKISDFGCSHFSEALFAASAAGGEEQYVDDIELAKTAGSPAFFAPEMCFSEIPEEPPQLPPVPKFTIRPPSTVVEGEGQVGTETVPFSPAAGADGLPPRLTDGSRSASEATLPRQRRPITNAIDVWALGVTLYCLLFGTTPFDAANEYLLMQAIPVEKYTIPPVMGRDRLPTDGTNEETMEALDLLSGLLEKDAGKRMTIDQAKHHPFTLRGLPNAKEWLAETDPHGTSYVTVTQDEVAAAVTRGGSIREKFKRGFSSISRRFRFGRNRSHSNADTASDADHIPGTPAGELPGRRVASGNDVPSATSVPATNLARRLSLLSRDRSRGNDSPRGSSVSSTPVPLELPSPQSNSPSPEEHLRPPQSNSATPRQMPSITSLDRFHSDSLRSESPSWRRGSSDIGIDSRARSASNASSAGSILGALGGKFRANSGGLAKTRSLRSAAQPMRGRGYTGSSEDTDGNVFAASSFASSTGLDGLPRAPSSEFLRGRSFDGLGRRTSTDAFEPSSPSSHGHGPFGHMSPERTGWFRDGDHPVRRGSTLSEDIRPVMEDEEVDWVGAVPDSDDEVQAEGESGEDDPLDGLPPGHGIRSAPADWNLSDSIASLERKERARQSPVRSTRPLRDRLGTSPQHSPLHTPVHSPHRAPPSSYGRAKSPLSPQERVLEGVATPTPGDAFADAEEGDEGIVLARRPRKGSTLSRGGSIREERVGGVGSGVGSTAGSTIGSAAGSTIGSAAGSTIGSAAGSTIGSAAGSTIGSAFGSTAV